MTPLIRVFDNGGKTFDRYTILINIDLYGMSANATAPNGFNQFCGAADFATIESIKQNNKELELLDAPLEVRLAIGKRLQEE